MITVDGFEVPEVYPLFLNRYYELLILMILNLLLAAYVNYVILTQSKTLGSFKYYLLNQFFWAQLHEYQFMLTCPVYLSPYMSGFMGGFFRPYGTSEATTIFAILGICFRAGTCTGVFMSLGNRFILTFHENLKSYMHNKTSFVSVFIIHVTMFTICSSVMTYLMHDNATIRQLAANETHGALNSYFTESSLMYIPELNGFPRKVCRVFFYIFIALSCSLLGGVTYFALTVFIRRKTSKVISQHAQSLIVSSLVQGVLCVVFLFIPFTYQIYTWAYKVENSANTVNFLFLFATLHGTIDMLCILYFVAPYRQYCKSILSEVFNRFKVHKNIVITSHVASSQVTREPY